jgi:hypothetical protein
MRPTTDSVFLLSLLQDCRGIVLSIGTSIITPANDEGRSAAKSWNRKNDGLRRIPLTYYSASRRYTIAVLQRLGSMANGATFKTLHGKEGVVKKEART